MLFRSVSQSRYVAFILGLILGYVIGKGNKEKFNSIQCSKNNDENTIKKNKFKINPIFNKSASLDFTLDKKNP